MFRKIATIGALTLFFATLSTTQSFALGPPGGGPTIGSISPASGGLAGGTAITITGTNFDLFTGTLTVSLDRASTHYPCANVTYVSPTSITCTTPAGSSGIYSVMVSGVLTAIKPSGFAYVAPISTSGVAPTSGSNAGGTAITVTGTGFVTGAVVSVGGSACTGVTVVSATSITCTAPAGTVGARDVVVTNTDTGASTLTGAYTYIAISSPTITTVAPTSGSSAGGTAITITGTGFVVGAVVSVGGAVCTGVTVVSATSITCTTPAGTVGARDVVVTNADTGAATRTSGFIYTTPADVVAPVVTVAPMTPEGAPAIHFTSTEVTCSLGKYSQAPASAVYTLVIGEDAVSTHFSNALIPSWLVPWAGKTTDYGNATATSASWNIQSSWKGKNLSCLTLAYANNATGSTSSSAVVPS